VISFNESQFLGPTAALVLSLFFIGVMVLGIRALALFIRGLMDDFKDAMAEVKAICHEMAESFKAQAEDWKEEAKACREHQELLVAELVKNREKTHV
jgi:hypothetical protein